MVPDPNSEPLICSNSSCVSVGKLRVGCRVVITVYTGEGVKYLLTVKRLKKKTSLYSDIKIHKKLRPLLRAYKDTIADGEWLFPSTVWGEYRAVG